MPADPVDDLYIHTCTVVQAASISVPDPLNPQGGSYTGIDFTSPVASTSGVRCRFMPVKATQRLQGELVETEKAGTVVASHMLQMPFDVAPASLRDLDALPDAAVTHRITNVLSPAGTVLDTGPLDIIYIYDPSADNTALVMLLKRVA